MLAGKAGVDNSPYKERAKQIRAEHQARVLQAMAERAALPKDADYAFIQDLVARMRQVKPLYNAATCPPRSHLSM